MLGALVLATTLAATPTATHAPVGAFDDPMTTDPGRFLVRRVSFGFGVRGWSDLYPCRVGRRLDGCGFSPVVAATMHVGWPKVTFVGELSSAPVPRIDYDYAVMDVVSASLGVSVGNARIRAALLGFAGFLSAGGKLRVTLSPWVDRRGNRHGIEASAGWDLYQGQATLSYRFIPKRLTQRLR